MRKHIVAVVLPFLRCFTGCQSLSTLHPKLLARKARSIKDTDQILSLLELTPNKEVVAIAALEACKKCDVALKIQRECPTSERVRQLAIRACGRSNNLDQALSLLTKEAQVGSWNAAIAACGKDPSRALHVMQNMPNEYVTSLSCNALLRCLCDSKQGDEAIAFWKSRKDVVNRQSYHYVIKTCIHSNMIKQAMDVLTEMEQSPDKGLRPTNFTFEIMSSTFAKRGYWDMAREIDARMHASQTEPSIPPVIHYRHQDWLSEDIAGLQKVGKGKEAYWVLGSYGNMTVALQPNRYASKNGIKLLFFANNHKMGYLPMINSQGRSKLLGIYLEPSLRQRGLSKTFLALWMHFCLEANIEMETALMRKPLLALVLQTSFGFVPHGKPGVKVEIAPSPRNSDHIVLYSSCVKSLRGAFSPWDIKREKMVLSSTPPEPRGRTIVMSCTLMAPKNKTKLRLDVDRYLDGRSFSFNFTSSDLSRILLGT